MYGSEKVNNIMLCRSGLRYEIVIKHYKLGTVYNT